MRHRSSETPSPPLSTTTVSVNNNNDNNNINKESDQNVLGEIKDRKIAFVEGLRGVSCVIVVIHHFILAYYPMFIGLTNNEIGSYTPPDGQPLPPAPQQGSFQIASSPLRFVWAGRTAVIMFFVLSGYVLSYKQVITGSILFPIRSTLRRYLRLMLPVLVSSFLFWVGQQVNIFAGARSMSALSQATWLAFPLESHPNFAEYLNESLFTIWFNSNSFFNTVLWTMQYEIKGSFLVFFLAIVSSSVHRGWLFCMMFFIVLISPNVLHFFKSRDPICYAAFLFGLLICLWNEWQYDEDNPKYSKYPLPRDSRISSICKKFWSTIGYGLTCGQRCKSINSPERSSHSFSETQSLLSHSSTATPSSDPDDDRTGFERWHFSNIYRSCSPRTQSVLQIVLVLVLLLFGWDFACFPQAGKDLISVPWYYVHYQIVSFYMGYSPNASDQSLVDAVSFVYCLLSSICIFCAVYHSALLRTVFGWSPFVYLGKVSFALYLVHCLFLFSMAPAISYALIQNHGVNYDVAATVASVSCVIVTMLFSHVFWWAIDRPSITFSTWVGNVVFPVVRADTNSAVEKGKASNSSADALLSASPKKDDLADQPPVVVLVNGDSEHTSSSTSSNRAV